MPAVGLRRKRGAKCAVGEAGIGKRGDLCRRVWLVKQLGPNRLLLDMEVYAVEFDGFFSPLL